MAVGPARTQVVPASAGIGRESAMAIATDLIGGIQTFVTPDLAQRLTTLVSERPAVTQTALKGAVPAILAGVLNLGSKLAGMDQLQTLLETDDRLPRSRSAPPFERSKPLTSNGRTCHEPV